MTIVFLLEIARLLPPLERAALKDLIIRRDNRLFDIIQNKDRHDALLHLVALEVVSNAFHLWYGLYDQLKMSTDTARYLNDNGNYNDELENISGTTRFSTCRFGVELTSTSSLVYGEIDFFGFAKLMEHVNPQTNQVFYDLGHGTGRAVIAAALLYPPLDCRGIEIVENLFFASENARKASNLSNVSFVLGDILSSTSWWVDGDIVFVNCTCFTNELFSRVQAKALLMKRGSMFISLTKKLHCDSFQEIAQIPMKTSWGEEIAFILQKLL
ncbi:hypothetical protein THRCLA_02853 [Thraustotheca clavata]|uniref:Histone-lysine N-methyltransferase, H3 lysine-79 specific n=1 Tax=Thraustotheca clavata TaxID=74557 RepID=A0A1W0A3V2_9STRA|nr:hypothetical protein THRCLA_02853 [Thraustotheca clavata]